MATKALTEWFSEIAPDIRGVPMPAAESAARNACIAFCEQTLLWEEELSRISIVKDQESYALTAPSDSEIISVERVLFKADAAADTTFVYLYPFSQAQKDLYAGNTQWQFQSATAPSGYYLDTDKNLHLHPIPSVASSEGLLVKVNLRPEHGCTTVPEFLYTDYYKAIGAGAKADLLARVGQPWANPETAVIYAKLFSDVIIAAKARKTTGDILDSVQAQTKPIVA
jgi:hypothetical protein